MGITTSGTRCGRTTKSPSGFCTDHESSSSANASLTPRASVDSLRPVSSSSGKSKGSNAWKNAMHPDIKLRTEQESVADRAFDEFVNKDKDRVQVRAACGMGKTIMEQTSILKYDDYLQETEGRSGNYLFVVPSISLANQMANDLVNDRVIQGIQYDQKSHLNSDILVVHNESPQFAATTDKEAAHHKIVSDFMSNGEDSDTPRVVITVVNSIDKVAQGQKKSKVDFDISMFDEAHNYSSTINKKDAKSPVLPIFFNEQENGIQSDKRMFFTATPKMKTKLLAPDRMIRGGFGSDESSGSSKSIKDKIVALSKKSSKSKVEMDVYQDGNTPEAFGEHIGNWGYRHAIMAGYLTKAEFHSNVVTGAGSTEAEARNFERSTKVDANGVATSDPNAISFGSYTSMKSIADSISQHGSRNVLSFLDRIEECEESKRNWEQYLLDMAESSNGRQFASDDDARMAVISRDPERVKAGKYYLMAKHASVTYSSSKSTQKERDEAESFFDSNEVGDRSPCTCGKPGGWCACARIVHNVDMFSEGISIKSIDTVVLNRPSYSSDSEINQAIGRASRKMNGKKIGKVILPRGAAKLDGDNTSGWSRPVDDKAYLKSTRAIHRIWNDVDGNFIGGNEAPMEHYEEDPLTLHDMSDNSCQPWMRPQHDMTKESWNVSSKVYTEPEGNAIVAAVWESALDKAGNEWNPQHPDEPFHSLPLQQRQSLARAQRLDVAASLSKNLSGDRLKQAIDILDFKTIDDYHAAKLHLSSNEDQAKAGERGYVTMQQSQTLIDQAKKPWKKNAAAAGQSGFSKDQWDSLHNVLFS